MNVNGGQTGRAGDKVGGGWGYKAYEMGVSVDSVGLSSHLAVSRVVWGLV